MSQVTVKGGAGMLEVEDEKFTVCEEKLDSLHAQMQL